MLMTVLVPTYRRPQDLMRCLNALQQQTRSPDEVLVVVQNTDTQTWEFLRSFDSGTLPLRLLTVPVTGVVAALNVGLEAATGDIISITDDDAVPHLDWLVRIEAHFLADQHIGGVGGRDWVYIGDKLLDVSMQPGASTQRVGKLQWFGRMIGNHHLGEGPPREVDLLKGVNMSFRRTAIAGLRCDERLRGSGAQVHFEMALSLSVQQRSWKLIYDPAVAVDHFIAPRFDDDQRNQFNFTAASNKVYNEALILFEHLPVIRQVAYIFWAILVGTRGAPGLIQLLRCFPQEGPLAMQKWLAANLGRWQAWQSHHQSRSAASNPTSQSLHSREAK